MCRLAGSPCFRIAGPWPPEDWWERARGVPFSPVRSSKQVGLGWDIRGVAARLTEDAIGKEEGIGEKKNTKDILQENVFTGFMCKSVPCWWVFLVH